MPINDYQLFVNIPQGPQEMPHIIRTIEFVLKDVHIKPTITGLPFTPATQEYMESHDNIRHLVRELMAEKGWDPVPDKTPFYLGMVILNSSRARGDLDSLIKTVMGAMKGVVFMHECWCDGISVIRPPQEGNTDDARITVSWKEIITPEEISNGRMGNS